jgi:shikimate dehydrogenase
MKFALTGWPLGHSLSPVFHNIALRSNGLDGEYTLRPVDSVAGLQKLLLEMRADPEWLGMNVTVPYKEKVIPFLDGLEGAAMKLRAVNTIARRGSRLIGYNTDMPGFLADLDRNTMKLAGGPALVLGSGGAARAVVLGLVECGCSVSIVAVLMDQAAQLASELGGGRVRVFGWEDSTLADVVREAKLIVNTTPIGMHPNVDATPWPSRLVFPVSAAAYDVVYTPPETRFLREARIAGARTASGLGMLVEQGALAFELWTSREAPRAEMMQATREALMAGG